MDEKSVNLPINPSDENSITDVSSPESSQFYNWKGNDTVLSMEGKESCKYPEPPVVQKNYPCLREQTERLSTENTTVNTLNGFTSYLVWDHSNNDLNSILCEPSCSNNPIENTDEKSVEELNGTFYFEGFDILQDLDDLRLNEINTDDFVKLQESSFQGTIEENDEAFPCMDGDNLAEFSFYSSQLTTSECDLQNVTMNSVQQESFFSCGTGDASRLTDTTFASLLNQTGFTDFSKSFSTSFIDNSSLTLSEKKRKRRKRKSVGLRRKSKSTPKPLVFRGGKEFLKEHYHLNESDELLISASDNILDNDAIQLARQARTKYLDSVVVAETGTIAHINFGNKYKIQAFYRSAYPPRYALLNELFICNTCFQYYATSDALTRHMVVCPWAIFPPGSEVYRDTENLLSVFEVDGEVQPKYCTNLSLITMLWLRDKVVYLDIEPFSYYVVAKPSENGKFEPMGYFSKQKIGGLNNNLCCFCVFPCFQKKGIGRFLIDLSYAISRHEGQPGGPERPFSALGEASYRSYWYETIIILFAEILQGVSKYSLSDIVKKTGMQVEDLVDTINRVFSCHRQRRKKCTMIDINNQKDLIIEEAQKIITKRKHVMIRDQFFERSFLKRLTHRLG